ncbi:hypothetical protein C0992_006042 [Termitomyces sp. T32_za158]|nr:hypothetical protein C0992_006042 [Termitomyces sp. T32_za158]
MSTDIVLVQLPDILADWPWKRVVNPHSSPQMKAQSMEWIQSFVSTPHMQRVFDRGEFDLMTPHEAQRLVALALDAMRNPERTRPAQECVAVEALRQ